MRCFYKMKEKDENAKLVMRGADTKAPNARQAWSRRKAGSFSLWNPVLHTFPTSELFLVLLTRLLTWAELTQSCRACEDNWDVTGEIAKRLEAWLETALKVS